MTYHDLVIIGGGPAGLAAAVSAHGAGVKDILILERDERLGGILNQCIHNGFGLHTFKEELTGPEYAERYIEKVLEAKIPYKLKTIAADISPEREILYVNSEEGAVTVKAGAIILAMGCRERPRGALGLPGYRPAGIFTAGTAQRLMNIEGQSVGKKVFILGSGDIGLIMARRMTLEGAQVCAVAELMPYSGGLNRNIVQCLNDFNIPLKLSHTVTQIHGKERVTGITISEVDANRQPIPGTEEYFDCDTLLLSCGLLPENELSKSAGITLDRVTGGPVVDDRLQCSVPGVFACGNVLHVHDLVDYVSEEAERAGAQAARYLSGENTSDGYVKLSTGFGVRYTVPQMIDVKNMSDEAVVRFRVADIYRSKSIVLYYGDKQIKKLKKRIMAPGEMEQIVIKKDSFDGGIPDSIKVCVED